MAKHCTVCNQDYADELAACPHCAAATQIQSAGHGQERTTQLVSRGDERNTRLSNDAPGDSAVDLGALPEEVAGSDSEVLMAELASNTPPVELVSDSAVDLGEGEVAAAAEGSSIVDLGAVSAESVEDAVAEEVEQIVEVTDGSGIDVGGAPVSVSPSDSSLHPASGSDIDLGAREAVPSSGIDVSEPGRSPASTHDMDLDAMQAEAAGGEPAVSEEEVDNLLAGLEETPAASAADSATAQEAAEIAEGEEAVAAAEAEEAAEAAEAKDEKPAKAAKPRSPILALAGSALLGIVVGAGGMFGVQALTGSGDKPKPAMQQMATQPRPGAGAAAPAPAPAPFEAQLARVANGDWDEAKTVGIEMVQGANVKELVALGEYHLGKYLKETGAKINTQDKGLQSAIQNLQKAAEQKDPNAVYDLAFIKELAGQLPEARADYAKGAQEFANDASQKQRFEAAVSRVEWKLSLKKSGSARAPLPQREEERALILALLPVALQAPPAVPAQQPKQPAPQAQPAAPPGQPAAPAAPAEKPEAGFEFWQAAKLANQGKFSDAVAALDQARKRHDERRFSRLRKAQNPLSDPAEDIFLRCCDELKAYWQLENQLREGGYLTDKNTPAQALQTLVQNAQGGAKVKELTDQLTAAKKGQQESTTKLAGVEKELQTAKNRNTQLDGDLKVKEKSLKEQDAALKSAKDQMAKLKSDHDTGNATLTKIRTELANAKLLDADGKGDLGAAVKNAIQVVKAKDSQGMLRRQSDEITHLSAALKQSRQPEEMLPLWSLLLDENRSRIELADQATVDAKRVLMDPRATAVQKNRAEIVLGLALRNAGKFSEARKVLEARRGGGDGSQWQGRAQAALREVSHPAAYYASRARDLYDSGRMEAALAVLDQAGKVLSAKEQGSLLAQRSLIELDAARSRVKGPLPPNEVMLIAATKDAEAAIKAGAAEGHYAAGCIAEELGRVDAAIESYRAALAAHGNQMDAAGGRYRMALARVLLLPREARPNPPAAPAKAAWKVGRRDSAKHFEDAKSLVVMMLFGLQAPLLPGEEPGLEEAEKLADEVLKAPPGAVPFNVLAQALAVKGRWSQALHVYMAGIRPMLPREYFNGLVYLLNNDPRLKRPDSLRTANPLAAEKHFAAGLNFYFDGDYANAEKELLLTVENDSQDARFFYFLGLSRLAQNHRRDAYADFTQAVILERLNRPASAAVSESLERIQGPTRLLLNGFREAPQR